METFTEIIQNSKQIIDLVNSFRPERFDKQNFDFWNTMYSDVFDIPLIKGEPYLIIRSNSTGVCSIRFSFNIVYCLAKLEVFSYDVGTCGKAEFDNWTNKYVFIKNLSKEGITKDNIRQYKKLYINEFIKSK